MGATQIVLSTRSQHDLTVTVKEAEGTRLRLDDVDLHALQARQASHVDLIVEVSDVPHDDLVLLGRRGACPDTLLSNQNE